jgi:hypothetical protein
LKLKKEEIGVKRIAANKKPTTKKWYSNII